MAADTAVEVRRRLLSWEMCLEKTSSLSYPAELVPHLSHGMRLLVPGSLEGEKLHGFQGANASYCQLSPTYRYLRRLLTILNKKWWCIPLTFL